MFNDILIHISTTTVPIKSIHVCSTDKGKERKKKGTLFKCLVDLALEN